MTAGTDLALARVRQLIRLTEDLTDRLINETRAFEARRPQDVVEGLAETQEMANAYRRESAQVKANPEILAGAPLGIGALLKQANLAPSTSEANRLIDGGGVRVDGGVVSDKGLKLEAGSYVVQVGKRKFARVTLA